MNRSERRRLDRVIKEVDNPVKYELSLHQIEKIKQDAVDEAVKIVEKNLIKVMFSLLILVAHWEFGFGPKRCERLANRICEEYEDKFKRQGMKPEEFAQAVGELTGIRIEQEDRYGKLCKHTWENDEGCRLKLHQYRNGCGEIQHRS